MIVLHALWNSEKSHLYVWAESSLLKSESKKSRKHVHPFALDDSSLRKEVEQLSRSDVVNSGTCTLVLPSTSRPVPSPELAAEHENPTRLAVWEIPVLIFDSYSCFNFLLSLSHPPHGVIFGSSLRFWIEVAKLSLELLTRQCFIPTIQENDTYQALWEAYITDTDNNRIQVLSRVMPPVCRAIPDKKVVPHDMIVHFLNSTIDAFVRKSVWPVIIHRRGRIPLPEKWLHALSGDDPVLPGNVKAFSHKMNSWIGQARPDSAPLRVCFRLDPPDGNDTWYLQFCLQARDDQSLLVPAEKIWRSHVVTFLNRTFENPQERLLEDLGKASQLYPEIERELRKQHPVNLNLTAEEAYTFLREYAPLLKESGFGVLLPSWWQKPVELGVKLKVKSAPRDRGRGLLGVNGIVEYDWEIALGEERISYEEFKRLADLKLPLVKVRGKWVELKLSDIERAITFFKERSSGEMELGEALRLGLEQEKSETGLPVIDVEAEGEIKQVLDNTRLSLINIPKTFKGTLRPYQVTGVSWLTFLDHLGLGACLADDMGLGKTIQVIALLLYERMHTEVTAAPTLVICPMSVVGNWCKEVERFAPSLRVMVHHGGERLSGITFAEKVNSSDVVITTYAVARLDRGTLSTISWERVILDEAQNIKNPWAKQTQAIKQIPAKNKVALTGTPVENRLLELWSIMDFLNKGYLGPLDKFRKKYTIPIERYHSTVKADTLKRLIQPFLLRRLKTDKTIIKDLPEKMEMSVFCNLTREQATLYEAVVKEMLEKIDDTEGITRKGLVLSTLMKLKQLCNHPALFLHDKSDLNERSGKLARLEEMLEEALSEGDKALIFTQFAEMGGMLQSYLQEQLDCEILFLHGGTPKKKRDFMVEQFQRGKPPLFILSLKAGGLGLNLTAANHVFHFDRWWNPAVENQATDRAFRIGQTKNVQVHKFVCIGTVEEQIDKMIEEKKELAERIIGTGESWITEMSTEELRELFTMKDTGGF